MMLEILKGVLAIVILVLLRELYGIIRINSDDKDNHK